MNKNSTSHNEFGKPEIIMLFVLGMVLVVFTLPVVILSFVFSYLTWASFQEREERKWIRSPVIAIAGFLVTASMYETFKFFLPSLTSGFVSQAKIKAILSTEIIMYGGAGYFAFLIAGFYLFEQRLNSNLAAYEKIRNLTIKSFFPIKVLVFTLQKGFQILFSAVFRGPVASNSIIMGIVSFFICSLLTEIPFGVGRLIFKHYPAYTFMSGIMTAYVILIWYYAISSKWRHEKKAVNFIGITKNKSAGIDIGRLVKPKRMNLSLTWKDINHHVHILGQPGAGKSVLIKNIYAHLISSGEGLMMIDLKADKSVREDFINLSLASGRSGDFILIDLSHPEKSQGYNPLLFGNATELKDKIIGAIDWSEQYYKKTSESVLLTVLRGMVWLRDNKNLTPTLEDLKCALSSLHGLSQLSELVEEPGIKNDILQLMIDSKKDLSKNIEGLKAEISLLVQSEFGSIFSKPSAISVLDAIKNKKIILVNLDGQTYSESAKKFGRMLLGDLRAASGYIVTKMKSEQRPKFTLIVDEFSDIVSNDEMAKTFVGFLNRCRGSGIGVVIAHQSLGDFKDDTVKAQIMDSTETLFSFVQKDPETCETLASIAGTKEEWKETEQTSENILFKEKTGMGTRRLTHEYIYHPNEFKNLNTGTAIYIAKKPSRHGVVEISMIEIPKKAEGEYFVTPVLADAHEFLNLNKKVMQSKKSYQESLGAGKPAPGEPPLEI